MKSITFLTFALTVILATFTACYKKQDTVAIISVTSQDGQAIINARVILYGSGSQGEVVVRDTAYTDTKGEALFNFNDIYQSGQAGVAVLDIDVLKNGTMSKGIIRVEQETTSKQTVILN